MALTQVPASMLQDNGAILGMVNRIINGRMEIDQENAGNPITPVGGYFFPVDQWGFYGSQNSKVTLQRVADAPAGFKNSLKLTVASQYASPTAGDEFIICTRLEGQNIIDLGFGTSSPAQISLFMYIKGSVAGTYPLYLRNSASNRYYVGSVTVTTSWASQLITLTADNTGTWLTDNQNGLEIGIDLGSGSNFGGATANAWTAGNLRKASGALSFVAQANGATLNFTGVELRKGTYTSVPTPDWRPYAVELGLCLRYFEKSWPVGTAVGTADEYGSLTTGSENASAITGTGYIFGRRSWRVEKRATPTVTLYDLLGASGAVSADVYGVSQYHGNAVFLSGQSTTSAAMGRTGASGTRNIANTCTFHYTSSARL